MEVTINREYDYSNIVPEIDKVQLLVEYCSKVYENFIKLVDEDEAKNEKIKYEFKNYTYKRHFGEEFSVTIYHEYNHVDCKNYQSFMELVSSNQVSNINRLDIELDINFKRGTGDNLETYENKYKISFKPYDIKFIRNSNRKDEEFETIEDNIKKILNVFKQQNSIFYSK